MEDPSQIPDWLGEGIVTLLGWVLMLVFTILGWIFRMVFDWWKHSRLPFKQDKEQFEDSLNSETISTVEFFVNNDNLFVEYNAVDGLDALLDKLRSMRWSSHENKKLRNKRKLFSNAVAEMVEFMKCLTQPKGSGGGVVLQQDDERKEKYLRIRDEFIKSFKDYRDYGTKLFSVKLSKEPSNA